jgi:hypothetical protein
MGLPIAGSVVSLAAVVIGVFWVARPGPFLATTSGQNGPDQATSATGNTPGPEANNVAPRGLSEEKDAPWVDASNGPIQHGDVRVQLTSVTLRNVRIRDVLGEESVSPTKNLTFGLLIENTSITRRIDFLGWSGAAAQTLTLAELSAGAGGSKPGGTDTPSAPDRNAASLTDNLGRTYQRIGLYLGAQIPGQVRTPTALPPGKRLEDLLVFEPLLDKIEFLRLTLPAAAFGDTGVLRLHIPKAMIRR